MLLLNYLIGKFMYRHFHDRPIHRVQRRMISVDNLFVFLRLLFFCFVVAICDLVHTVEATYGLP